MFFISINLIFENRYKKYVDTINRSILIARLKLKIKNERLLKIILKIFNTNIISPFGI